MHRGCFGTVFEPCTFGPKRLQLVNGWIGNGLGCSGVGLEFGQCDSDMKRLFKTISGKIAVIFLINGIVLVIAMFFIISQTIFRIESRVASEEIRSDIGYLECLIDHCQQATWSIQHGMLYRGATPIGSGKEEDANLVPFLEAAERTGTTFLAGIRVSDDTLATVGPIYGEEPGHYKFVASSLGDISGDKVIGFHMGKTATDIIDKEGSYEGILKLEGKLVYCVFQSVYDDRGNKVGLIGAGRSVDEIKSASLLAGRQMLLILLGIIILASSTIIFVSHRITSRFSSIQEYLNRIVGGNYPEEKLVILSRDETADVAESINGMVDSLRKTERLSLELSLASDIQKNMLPCIFPPFPDAHEFDIFASMMPAKEVGGDFYDFFMLDEKRIAVVIADVSGKGVSSALVMVIAKTLIKNHMMYGLDPKTVFTTVNKMLCESNEANMFVTAWMGVLNTETGILTYVNAGHNPPLIKHNGQFEFLKSRPGLVLAGMDGIRYKQTELQLAPGDRVFLYTDGATEAVNAKEEMYGEKRLQDFLNQHSNDTATDLLTNLKKDIDAFSGEIEQFDDITMLMLDFHKTFENKNMIERVFPADDQSLSDATAFLERELIKLNCNQKALMQLCVAVEEIFVNIAHYAYPAVNGTVRISVQNVEDDRVLLRFDDFGIPFNPLEKPDPNVTGSAEERDIGGLGIFMTKKAVDNISYEYVNNQNMLTIEKKIK